MKEPIDYIFCTWLTRKEAAEYFKVSTGTITNIAREMRQKGYPGVVGEYRGRRYCKEAMNEYLLERGKENERNIYMRADRILDRLAQGICRTAGTVDEHGSRIPADIRKGH